MNALRTLCTRARRSAVALGLAAWLTACTVTTTVEGGALPASADLLVGRTTKAEALALLGAPLSVRRQFDGDMLLWIRRVSHGTRLRLLPFLPIYETSDGTSNEDVLALLFDHDGILAGVGLQHDIDA